VRIADGCVVFAGSAGAGKSTMATLCRQAGYEVICDDLCPVTVDAAGPAVVVYDRRPSATGPADAAPAGAGAAIADIPDIDAAPPARPFERRRRRRNGARDPFAAAMARHRAPMMACLERHAVNVAGAPTIALRFHIDEDGSVRAAELTSASLADTELGRCIVKVAQRVAFPRQPAPVVVRIPLTVRKR